MKNWWMMKALRVGSELLHFGEFASSIAIIRDIRGCRFTDFSHNFWNELLQNFWGELVTLYRCGRHLGWHRQISQRIWTLENNGIRGLSLDLFRSYLTNGKQVARIGNDFSETKTIECGVPQETILGSVLFNLYINDLFRLNSSGSLLGYADDTAVFYETDIWKDLRNEVADDFCRVKTWFDHRLLTINLEETNFITFRCHTVGEALIIPLI